MVAVPLGPAPVDITGVRAGDKNEFQITLVSAGRGLDLTGMTLKASAKKTKTDTTSLDAIVTVTDGPNGVVLLRWPGDAVRTWMGTNLTQKGVWDMQMKSGTNDPITVVAGDFSSEMDVTQ
jgi:hypothetical protein